MTTPKASEMFMAIWNKEMWAEGNTVPGSKDWKPELKKFWVRVWLDCSDLARDIMQAENMAGKAIDIANGLPGEDASIDSALKKMIDSSVDKDVLSEE